MSQVFSSRFFEGGCFSTKGKRQELRILHKTLHVNPLFNDNFNPTQTIPHFYDSMILLRYPYTFVEFQVPLYYLSENALYFFFWHSLIIPSKISFRTFMLNLQFSVLHDFVKAGKKDEVQNL